ncbi:uncharacterized protein DMAD_05946 [Drosophila madeirensis]|uniref:F-box domain-containing protein n=1 Tax=Drosophila madeirensis TaxID=30013 RepID=A0AAU9FPU4_DROMD
MLSQLPIEILDKIFNCLEEADKLNLARVSQHFEYVFAYNARKKYEKLVCSRYSDDDLRVILSCCGHTVVHLEIVYSAEQHICDLVLEYCIKLEYVYLDMENVHAFCSMIELIGLGRIDSARNPENVISSLNINSKLLHICPKHKPLKLILYIRSKRSEQKGVTAGLAPGAEICLNSFVEQITGKGLISKSVGLLIKCLASNWNLKWSWK